MHTVGYRSLVAATGARQAYFGRDEFEKVTYALKTVEDAERLRRQILRCFEEAHTTADPERRRNLLSFVVIGAGATGVELAGQIKELAGRYFEQSFHDISADDVYSIVHAAAKGYQYVLIDIGMRTDASVEMCFGVADIIVLVTTPDVVAVRDAFRRLKLLERLGIEKDRVKLVVNRARRNSFVSLEDGPDCPSL